MLGRAGEDGVQAELGHLAGGLGRGQGYTKSRRTPSLEIMHFQRQQDQTAINVERWMFNQILHFEASPPQHMC